jgi:small GTP-binding protein
LSNDNTTGNLKIFVAGPYHAGKTTLVHLLDKKAQSVERTLPDGTTSTMAFDLGHVWWDQGENIYTDDEITTNPCNALRVVLMGSPGQIHMAPIREVTSMGAKGVLFIIDSTAPGQIGHAIAIFEEVRSHLGKEVPMVVIANKQDVSNAVKADSLKNLMKVDSVSFIDGSALTGQGIKQALIQLLKIIKTRGFIDS